MKLNASQWRLPSGRPLGEYALEAGFIAPRLWTTAVESRTMDSNRHGQLESAGCAQLSAASLVPHRRRALRESDNTAPVRGC
jgi:hypothetical protein